MSYHQESSQRSDQEIRYWAFISYSQRDAAWARWLHQTLERYKVPRELRGRRVGNRLVSRGLFPIFRDREELPSAGDLSEKIREALKASHALIVICSPHAAVSQWVNEEIRTFKALGRSQRVFPLIIDGEPNASDRQQHGELECFPPALRFGVAADGALTDRRSNPIAADVREGKDGKANARLKLIAGILDTGFDDLRHRESGRQRRRQLIGVLASLTGLLLVAATYLGLADAELDVPGGTGLRRQFDRYGFTVFRPVAPFEESARRAIQIRTQLRQLLVAALARGDLTFNREATDSVWSLGQAAAAIYRDVASTGNDIRILTPMLDRIFESEFPLKSNGKLVGWRGDAGLPRVETSLWIIMALVQAIKRKDEQIDETLRSRYAEYLEIAEEIAENYYPLNDGGWNTVIQDGREDHSVYSSALALNVLLDLKSADICWRGNCNQLEKMIRDTSRWIIEKYVNDKTVKGWRYADSAANELPPNQELSLFVYGILGRLSEPIPEDIERGALDALSDLRNKSYHPASREIVQYGAFTNEAGTKETGWVRTVVFWYPWALEGLMNWLRHTQDQKYPSEVKRALERSLGHVLFADSPDMLNDLSRYAVYVVAETYYGVASIPRAARDSKN